MNLTDTKNDMEKDYIYSNAKLHYTIVSGNSDEPFVLIHGQCMCGLDYDKVTEKLSEKYTLYLIDCFGHGESEKAPELYCCRIIGDAIADLIRNEIGRPCIVSGHSSGGILAAYVAGVMPELVKGILLEDPPFFNVQPGEFENTLDSLMKTETIDGKTVIPPAQKDKNIWGSVTMNDRGQVVIPIAAREKLGINGGQRLIVLSDKEGIALILAELFEEKMQKLMEYASMKADETDL